MIFFIIYIYIYICIFFGLKENFIKLTERRKGRTKPVIASSPQISLN